MLVTIGACTGILITLTQGIVCARSYDRNADVPLEAFACVSDAEESLIPGLSLVQKSQHAQQLPLGDETRAKHLRVEQGRVIVDDASAEKDHEPRGKSLLQVNVSHGPTLLQVSDLNQVSRIQGSDGTCLNFLHIPKTGGTSIEDEGYEAPELDSQLWGRFANLGCSAPCGTWSEPGVWPMCHIGENCCSVWHIPPLMDSMLAGQYQGCDTFCVVRSPVERFISQYKFRGGPCNQEVFAKDSRKKLAQLRSDSGRYIDDCHYLPQVEYVFGRADLQNHTMRPFCQHVLKQENLVEDFNALMARFSLPLTLQAHSYEMDTCKIPVARDVRKGIEDYYAEDFSAFGYQRM
mmetsp:Transcript_138170/g.358959  ORF Transcript_138170/g.358959 Transcript_138170/m.358959 type:complete len:348 (-) Transcript_138170:145-1188(-)